jgi:hypothetical protein
VVDEIKETNRLKKKINGDLEGILKTTLTILIPLICLIPLLFKELRRNTPIRSTSCFLATEAFAKELILVQGAPRTGCGSPKKNDILLFLFN